MTGRQYRWGPTATCVCPLLMALHRVSLALSESLRRLIPSLSQADVSILSRCRPVESRAARPNTHWQCNGALLLSSAQYSKYGQSSARQFAERVVQDLILHRPAMLESACVSGPGFITITADRCWLLHETLSDIPIVPSDLLGEPKQKILIDMSSPNIAKRMHVGHIRSTVIGEALANLLQAQGHEVIKINHVGDFGTQFGLLMAAIRFQKVHLDKLGIHDLEQLYRFGKQNSNEDFLAECRRYVSKLQTGDPETVKIWQKIKAISRKEYEEIYRKLDIESLIERGESFYAPYLQSAVSDLLGCSIAQYSKGAVCVFQKESDFPLIIRKSDGSYTYGTTDLAALRYRFQTDKADRIIYVVDQGQEQHFKKVFSTGRKAGWIPERAQCQFVGFGVVLGPDGKKFRTRLGGVMNLSDLLDTAVSRAKEILTTRGFQENEVLSLDKASEAIGLSAIKYADLNRHRDTNISFDVEAMLDLKGNTSVYLQYTRCRAVKLLRDVRLKSMDSETRSMYDEACDDAERNLCVAILGYADALNEAAHRLEPHIFCHYLYSLASSTNYFYTKCPVLGHERQFIRARILQRAVQRLEEGFKILGIAIIDRM